MLTRYSFMSVKEHYGGVGPREFAQLIQAFIATSGSRLVPPAWCHATLECPGEVARVACQQNWRPTVDQIRNVIIGVSGDRDRPKRAIAEEINTPSERRHSRCSRKINS